MYRELTLKFCRVRVYTEQQYIETIFHDGRVSGATRELTPENFEQAREQGYTGDDAVWLSLRDHEILHSLLCEVFFGTASHVLRHQSGAVKQLLCLREWEEGFVLAFQYYANTGKILPPLYQWTEMLSEATMRWIEIGAQLAS